MCVGWITIDSELTESSYNSDEFKQDYHPQLVDATSAEAPVYQAAPRAPIAGCTVLSSAHKAPTTNSVDPTSPTIITSVRQGKPVKKKRRVTVSDIQKLCNNVNMIYCIYVSIKLIIVKNMCL